LATRVHYRSMRSPLNRFAKGSEVTTSAVYMEAINYLDNRVGETDPVQHTTKTVDFSVFPEYRERGLRSLLAELTFVASDAEITNLHRTKALYEQLGLMPTTRYPWAPCRLRMTRPRNRSWTRHFRQHLMLWARWQCP
jgi:hypothetical protein